MKNIHDDLYNKLVEKYSMIKINNQIINEELNNALNIEYISMPQIYPVTNRTTKIDSENIRDIYDMSLANNIDIANYFKDFRDYKKFVKDSKYGKILYSPHISETIIDLGIIFNRIKEKNEKFYYFFNFKFNNFDKSNYIAICIYDNQLITFTECKKRRNDNYKKYYTINLLLSIQLGFSSILFSETGNILNSINMIMNSPNKDYVITQTEYDIYENANEIATLYKPYYSKYTNKYNITNL